MSRHLPASTAPILLALVFTLLNAFKPLHMDDTAYYYYAAQIAHSPLDPYGFEVYWFDGPEPANHVLVPPLFPYWWSIILRVSDEPVVWKLWLFPIALLLTWSLTALFRRFAPGLETPLSWLTVLSPSLLPSLNLMLDVPALTLSLSALEVFFRAVERQSYRLTVAAGVIAGLAMQTKYTALLAPAVMLWYAPLYRRWWLGVLAATVAGLLFLGWEAFVWIRYGDSHFLYQILSPHGHPRGRATFILPLITILGGVLPIVAVVPWLHGRLGWRTIALLCTADVLGHGLLGLGLPSEILFGVLGAGVVVSAAGTLWRLVMCTRWSASSHSERGTIVPRVGVQADVEGSDVAGSLGGLSSPARFPGVAGRWGLPSENRAADWFLLGWLLLELIGYFVLSPFPAVRRVLGIVVVSTLLVGRVASRRPWQSEQLRLLWGVVTANSVLALLLWYVDLREALVTRDAAEVTAARIRHDDPTATIWYVGHWGFQFYAERSGQLPVAPGRSQMGRGDWLVMPDAIEQPLIVVDDTWTERAGAPFPCAWSDSIPLRTMYNYYARGSPLKYLQQPRLTVTVYRVTRDHIPVLE